MKRLGVSLQQHVAVSEVSLPTAAIPRFLTLPHLADESTGESALQPIRNHTNV